MVCNIPFPVGSPGAERIKAFAKGFYEHGWEVVIINFGKDTRSQQTQNDAFPFTFHYFKESYSGRKIGKYLRLYFPPTREITEFIRLNSDSRRDVVYIYGYLFSEYYRLVNWLRKIGYKVLIDVNEHPSDFEGIGGLLNPNFINFCLGYAFTLNRANILICISEYLMNSLKSRSGRRALIPCLQDYEIVPDFEVSRDRDICHLLYVGRLRKRDCPELMFRIVNSLIEVGLRVKFHLVGAYENYRRGDSALQLQLMKFPKVADSIQLHGFVEQSRMEELMRLCTAAFLLRRDHRAERASFPTRLGEFLKFGLSIITTAVPDMPLYLERSSCCLLLDSEAIDKVRVDQCVKFIDAINVDSSKARMEAFTLGKEHFSIRENVSKLIKTHL